MSSETFYTTQQDLRKPESHASHARGGNTPANSNISAMKVTSNLLTHRPINLATRLLTLRISPSSTSIQTRPRPSKNARPTCLCQNSLPSPAIGRLQTRELSTSAPAAYKDPSPARATELSEGPLLQKVAHGSRQRNYTRKPSPQAMLVAKARKDFRISRRMPSLENNSCCLMNLSIQIL